MKSFDYNRANTAPVTPVESPANCPSCGSPEVQTTSKVTRAGSYWRCAGWGEAWNVGRPRAGTRANSYQRFSR